jgi:cyclin H
MNSISTQAKHWIFSSEELSKKRISAFEDSKIRVSQAWKLENEITKNSKKVEFLTLNDQMNLISFFETKIVVYCKVFKFDKNVKATALMLFKRFFIKGTAMEHDPARILITCLFLGSKIEHQPVALAEFLTKIPKSPIKESQMVELEVISV